MEEWVVEPFSGKLRYGVLNREVFDTLHEAKYLWSAVGGNIIRYGHIVHSGIDHKPQGRFSALIEQAIRCCLVPRRATSQQPP